MFKNALKMSICLEVAKYVNSGTTVWYADNYICSWYQISHLGPGAQVPPQPTKNLKIKIILTFSYLYYKSQNLSNIWDNTYVMRGW